MRDGLADHLGWRTSSLVADLEVGQRSGYGRRETMGKSMAAKGVAAGLVVVSGTAEHRSNVQGSTRPQKREPAEGREEPTAARFEKVSSGPRWQRTPHSLAKPLPWTAEKYVPRHLRPVVAAESIR